MSNMVACPLGTRCLTGNTQHQKGSQSLENCLVASSGRMSGAAVSSGDISSEFVSEVAEEKTSIFSPDFRDVLIDRYGEDVRELDERRKELANEEAQATADYLHMKKFFDERVKNGKDTPESHSLLAEKKKIMDEKACAYRDFSEENPVDYPQYWLVEDGHFHDSLRCSTLRPGTQVSLYTPASGMESDEAIELAGSRVCTHCIPDAPVDALNSPSHVMTDNERAREEERAEREKDRKRKEEEAKERAVKRQEQEIERQKRAAGDALADPVPVPFLNSGGYDSPATEAGTAKAARDAIKVSVLSAGTSQMTMLYGYSDEEMMEKEISGIQYNTQLSDEQKRDCENVMREATGHGRFWAAQVSMGNVDQMTSDLEKVNTAVQALAAKKGKTPEKMMDELFGKRGLNTFLNQSKKSIRGKEYWKENPNAESDMTERFDHIVSWIKEPSRYREYLQGE